LEKFLEFGCLLKNDAMYYMLGCNLILRKWVYIRRIGNMTKMERNIVMGTLVSLLANLGNPWP